MDSDPLVLGAQSTRSLVIASYMSYVMLTVVCVEHVLTLGHECNCLRKRKWNAATWLFLVNRYVLLTATITYLVPRNSKSCTNSASRVISAIFMVSPSMITVVFSALRVFALEEGRYVLPGIILLFSLAAEAFNTYFQCKATKVVVAHTILGPLCITITSEPNAIDIYGMLIVPVFLLVADFIAIVATWRKTYHHARQAISLGIPTVAKILLRDGSLYFFALFLLTVVQLLAVRMPALNFAEDAFYFSKMMPNVLLGRFLINLRRVTDQQTLSGGQLSEPIQFASDRRGFHGAIVSMAAPFGEPVDYVAEDSCSRSEENEAALGLHGAVDMGSCRIGPEGVRGALARPACGHGRFPGA